MTTFFLGIYFWDILHFVHKSLDHWKNYWNQGIKRSLFNTITQDIHLQINGKTSQKSLYYEFVILLFSAWSWPVCQTCHLKYRNANLIVLFYFEEKTDTPNAALNYGTLHCTDFQGVCHFMFYTLVDHSSWPINATEITVQFL